MLPVIGVYAAYSFGGIGILLIVIGGILNFTKSWRNSHTEFHNEDENDDELRR